MNSDCEPSPYIIQKMTKDDIDEVLKIEKNANINMLNSSMLINYIETPNSLLYVAKFNFEIVGFVIFTVLFDHIDLDFIAVKEDFRRKGVATSLLNKLYCIALKQEIFDIFLEVRVSNKDAINFYENQGFENISVRKNYYTKNGKIEDAVIYQLKIQNEI